MISAIYSLESNSHFNFTKDHLHNGKVSTVLQQHHEL